VPSDLLLPSVGVDEATMAAEAVKIARSRLEGESGKGLNHFIADIRNCE
jgi:hypothetical protein